MTEAIQQLILLYASQALRKELDLDGNGDVRSSGEEFVKALEAIEVQKHLDVWYVLESFSRMQKFLSHIPYHQGTYYGEKGLFKECRIFWQISGAEYGG